LVTYSDGKCEASGLSLYQMLVLRVTPAPVIFTPHSRDAIDVILWKIECLGLDDDEAVLRMFEALDAYYAEQERLAAEAEKRAKEEAKRAEEEGKAKIDKPAPEVSAVKVHEAPGGW
jgi:protein-disulfide isomerase